MMLARAAAVAILSCGLVSTAVAQRAEPRSFRIPGHGSLVLAVPAGWRVAERSLDDPPSANLRIGPAAGDAFSVQATAVWLEPAKLAAYTPEEVKARVEKTAENLLPQAVEKQATLVELRGKEAYGHHFSLTDRSSTNGPDDYKYVTQGILVTGELVTVFTFLHREPSPAETQQVLRMFADARYAREAAAPRADVLQVKELEQGYELSVPVSRLVMTIPKSGMPGAKRQRGLNDHSRYFYFRAGGLNVSGWFEPAAGFHGIQPFWEQETATWVKRGLPPPVDTVFTKVGQWDSVFYDIAVPAGTNSHLRAHWVQGGHVDRPASLADLRSTEGRNPREAHRAAEVDRGEREELATGVRRAPGGAGAWRRSP